MREAGWFAGNMETASCFVQDAVSMFSVHGG